MLRCFQFTIGELSVAHKRFAEDTVLFESGRGMIWRSLKLSEGVVAIGIMHPRRIR